MKITKIGAVTLDYGMWWDGYDRSTGVASRAIRNIDGGIIVFEQANRVSTINITLSSRDNEWQKKATVDALKALADNSIGKDIVIVDSDGNTYTTRFRHEESGGAVQFERLVDAMDFEWYAGKIYLARI